MSLKQTGFFNFGEMRQKEYDKKLVVISPTEGAIKRNSSNLNNLTAGTVVGFIDELPRISGTANWKAYSELLSDVFGSADMLKDTLAATAGSTDFMYGDTTAKFFTGGGEVSLTFTFRCISYTPWESRYSSSVKPIEVSGGKYLIGDCRFSFNNIFALCFPGYTDSITGEMVSNAGNTVNSIKTFIDGKENAGKWKDAADTFMKSFTRSQPMVSLSIGHGDVSYFSSNKMIVKSVDVAYSEEWVKLNEATAPVPMYCDISVTMELAQLAGLTDFNNKGGAISINFAEGVRKEGT